MLLLCHVSGCGGAKRDEKKNERKKLHFFLKAKRSGNAFDLFKAKSLQQHLKWLIHTSHTSYVQFIASTASGCQKMLLAYVTSQRQSKPSPHFVSQGTSVTDPKSTADMFSLPFSQTRRIESSPAPVTCPSHLPQPRLYSPLPRYR